VATDSIKISLSFHLLRATKKKTSERILTRPFKDFSLASDGGDILEAFLCDVIFL